MTDKDNIQWDYSAPHTLQVTVESKHIDGVNHTNNAVYVQWCEATAWSHSESLGLGLSDYQRLNRAMAIVEARYQYLAPSNKGDQLIIATWLAKGEGRIPLQRRFQICNSFNGKTLLRGQWDFVCINIETGRPARMPVEFTDAYMPALIDTSSTKS